MRNKMLLTGYLQYFMGMERPTNVSFDGVLKKDRKETEVNCTHVEELLNHYVCTKKVGSTSKPAKVKITIEWE